MYLLGSFFVVVETEIPRSIQSKKYVSHLCGTPLEPGRRSFVMQDAHEATSDLSAVMLST